MNELETLVEIYRPMVRQGPGSRETTVRAIDLADLRGGCDLRIADIGSGTGAASMDLARELTAEVVAVDFISAFLSELETRANDAGLGDSVTTCEASMVDMPFAAAEFDCLWSEGAIYNMGFAEGVQAWRHFLKPGGVLAVSEITWLTADRPAEIEEYWRREYPQIDTAGAKIEILEHSGYTPSGYFVLPRQCWEQEFYEPVEARLLDVAQEHRGDESVQTVIQAHFDEIALYRRYSEFFSYGFYIATRTA